jgi:hypothetical protein
MKTFLLAGASIFAASLSPYFAYAQPQMDSQSSPPNLIPYFTLLPPNGCVWAGLAYSNGAQLCMAPKLVMKCNSGSWSLEPSSVSPDPCANFQPK